MSEEPKQPSDDSKEPATTDPATTEPTTTKPGTTDPASDMEVANKVDQKQIAQFVTTIKNSEQQVGEHIIEALQHEDTVAVITTVMIGPDGQQHVVSAALNPDRMEQVQEILKTATEERVDEEPCVGFHCLVKRKDA
ncbi:MAG: hypothetical protein HKN47_22915 [Pirellulaceae bacterium]|nr:hypothetical protein [Pirellulaceae bacterium]